MDLDRCLVTLAEVKPCQVAKWPLLMALHNVDGTGLKQAWWRNCVKSLVLEASATLFMLESGRGGDGNVWLVARGVVLGVGCGGLVARVWLLGAGDS